ncbi:conserved hypothetical protein [Coccidioides posadasii str. Silveira]|uniref:Uncharacterized protein n=1 Tax=Coccidioides posadasii (strain RMSCC 757 / Silveira) TaxID=443226 RepID=E9DH65_COCPS|nr:conserved hypothetical protein [Coccidioides posadasii str. Silveira]
MLLLKDSVAHNKEDTLSCSICVYSMFTDCLDEESTIKLVCQLLQLQEEYHSFDTADPCHPYNIKCMSILVHEFHGLDSGATKYCCCQVTSIVEEPSMKHHHPASHHVVKTMDLMSEMESTKDSLSEFSHSSSPVCTVLSQVENKVVNIQVSLDYLTTCLTSGTKALQDSTEISLIDLLYHLTCSQTNFCLGQPHIFY